MTFHPQIATVNIGDCCKADQPDEDYVVNTNTGRVCCAYCLDSLLDADTIPETQRAKMEHL